MTSTGLMRPIAVDGLNDLRKAAKAIGDGSEKELRPALNEAAQIVVNVAQRRVPVRTGAARKSIGVASTGNKMRIKAGGTKAPYFPWLDYGGKTGRNRSVSRPFERHGRYLYPAFWSQYDNIRRLLEKRLTEFIESKGLEIT